MLLANARAPSPSFPLRIPQHFSTITHDFSSPDHSTLPDSVSFWGIFKENLAKNSFKFSFEKQFWNKKNLKNFLEFFFFWNFFKLIFSKIYNFQIFQVCPYPPADVTKVTVQEIKNNETPRSELKILKHSRKKIFFFRNFQISSRYSANFRDKLLKTNNSIFSCQ